MIFGLGIKSVTTAQLAERMAAGKITLLDVREPYEYAAGHVKGAVNVPLGSLQGKLDRYARDAEIYVICHSGSRSASAVRLMKRAGFTNVINVAGGTSAWRGKLAK